MNTRENLLDWFFRVMEVAEFNRRRGTHYLCALKQSEQVLESLMTYDYLVTNFYPNHPDRKRFEERTGRYLRFLRHPLVSDFKDLEREGL